MHVLFQKYLEKSSFELAHGEAEAALRSVEAACHLAPWEPETIQARLSVLRCLGRWEEAHAYILDRLQGFEAAPDLATEGHPPQWHPRASWLRLELAEIFVNGLRQPHAALQIVGDLLRDEDKTAEGLELRRLLRIEAEAFLDLGQIDEAIQALRCLWRRYPQDRQIRALLGWAYLQNHAYIDAIFLFRQIVLLDDKDADAHYFLGVAHESVGAESQARRAFLAASALDRAFPPRLRFSSAELSEIATSIVLPLFQSAGISVQIEWADLPSPDQPGLPFDPRRIAGLIFEPTSHFSHLRELRATLTLFRWNLERFCLSLPEIRDEIHALALAEIQRLALTSSLVSNDG